MNEKQILLLLENVKNTLQQYPSLRPGQVMFNCLEDISLDIANRVRATNSDPYYDSKRMLACLGIITTNELYHKYKDKFAILFKTTLYTTMSDNIGQMKEEDAQTHIDRMNEQDKTNMWRRDYSDQMIVEDEVDEDMNNPCIRQEGYVFVTCTYIESDRF